MSAQGYQPVTCLLILLFASLSVECGGNEEAMESVFSKENLIAWCVVPFDSTARGPQERAEMLVELGIGRLAYDWRDKDIPTFADEI